MSLESSKERGESCAWKVDLGTWTVLARNPLLVVTPVGEIVCCRKLSLLPAVDQSLLWQKVPPTGHYTLPSWLLRRLSNFGPVVTKTHWNYMPPRFISPLRNQVPLIFSEFSQIFSLKNSQIFGFNPQASSTNWLLTFSSIPASFFNSLSSFFV